MALAVRLDDVEVGAFMRQLEDLETEIDRVEPLDLPFFNGDIVPLQFKNQPWAQYWTYRQISHVGSFRLARNYTTDIPTVEVRFREFRKKIKKWESSYWYSDDDVAAVVRMGESLESEKIYAVNESYQQTLNELIAFGEPSLEMDGFINHRDALRSEAAYPLNSSSTARQQLAVLNDATREIVRITKGKEKPDTLLMPIETRDFLASNLIELGSTALPKTVLQHFLDSNGYIQNIVAMNECSKETLEEVGVGSKDIIVAYKRDQSKVKAKVYQSLSWKEARRQGVDSWARPCVFKYGGIDLRRPMSMHVVQLPE